MVPQCAGGLVSRPEPVCASRWLCVFLCVGDDHISVMWLDVFSVVWLIWLVPLPSSLATSCRAPLLQPLFFIPPSPLSCLFLVVMWLLLWSSPFWGMWGIYTEKCPVSDMACQSVGGRGVTGTPKIFSTAHTSGYTLKKKQTRRVESSAPPQTTTSADIRHIQILPTTLSSCYTTKGVWKACKMHSQNHFTVKVI